MRVRSTIGLWEPSTAMRRCRAEVSRAFGVTPWALVGPDRFDNICRARFAAAWVLKARWPKLSRMQIAHLLGCEDHSTGIYSVQRARELRRTDMVFHAFTDALAAQRALPAVPLSGVAAGRVRCRAEIVPLRAVKPKNDLQEDDSDARRRSEASAAFLTALGRSYPERMVA